MKRKDLLPVVIGITVWVVLFAVFVQRSPSFVPVVRDAVIGIVAHHNAGPEIPLDADYTGDKLIPVEETWGIQTNSHWLALLTLRVVPYMSYEHLTVSGQYPVTIVWSPVKDDRSFHILGSADTTDKVIVLNEREVTDPYFQDEREAYATVVHELIHIQGGNFADDVTVSSWDEKSAHLESATTAATVEVLAAMCNYGDPVACRAFWLEIEASARYSLRAKLQPFAYKLYVYAFLNDASHKKRAEKSARYWADKQDVLTGIVKKYGVHPWEAHILPGLHGIPLYTGNAQVIYVYGGIGIPIIQTEVLMPFDDTSNLLGIWNFWLEWLS